MQGTDVNGERFMQKIKDPAWLAGVLETLASETAREAMREELAAALGELEADKLMDSLPSMADAVQVKNKLAVMAKNSMARRANHGKKQR